MNNHKIPVILVDNFFDDPDAIRNYALSLEFKKTEGSYPGLRTNLLDTINPVFFNELSLKIFSLLFDFQTQRVGGHLQACFQIITEDYEEGWVHSDLNDWALAGIIYLNPNAPLTGGTSLYKLKDGNEHPKTNDYKDKFYSKENIDINDYRKHRNEHNNHYEKTLEISNVYNRLVMYNTDRLHRGDIFFGNDFQTGRLTLVFFAKIYNDGVLCPIERMSNQQITKLGNGTK